MTRLDVFSHYSHIYCTIYHLLFFMFCLLPPKGALNRHVVQRMIESKEVKMKIEHQLCGVLGC